MGAKRDKLIQSLRNNPSNVRFEELRALLEYYGFTIRQKARGSSHYVFEHRALHRPALTVPKGKPVKAFYVRKALELIEEIREATKDEGEED